MSINTTTRPGPKAQAIIERDSAVMTGAITPRYPFVIERGEGSPAIHIPKWSKPSSSRPKNSFILQAQIIITMSR